MHSNNKLSNYQCFLLEAMIDKLQNENKLSFKNGSWLYA